MAENDKTEKQTAERLAKNDQPLMSWSAPDSVIQRRDNRFYSIIVIAGCVLIAILAWQKIWSGAILVAVATLTLFILGQSKPKNVESAIFEKGIVVGDRVYDYSDFKSFWVTLSEVGKVRFQQNGRFFAGVVMMPVLEKDIEKIREILLKRLPEESDKGEDIVDVINRFIRL